MFPEGRILDFMIVGALALIVVGPKDLPLLMRKIGQFVARMRAMAAEFRASFDEIARQSELEELRREVEAMRVGNLRTAATDYVVGSETRRVFEDIHTDLTGAGQAQVEASPAPADSDQPDLPFGGAAPPHEGDEAGEPPVEAAS